MKQTILIPIDFSDVTYRQLQAARPFCEPGQTSVVLLHVHHSRLNPLQKLAAHEVDDTEQHRLMDINLRSLDEMLEGMDVETSGVFREGDHAKTVLKIAEEIGATLLISGSHGHGAAYDFFVGSVTRRLLARAKVPLVVVPGQGGKLQDELGQIVVAVDFAEHTDDLVLRAAVLADRASAKLRVLHVVPPMQAIGEGYPGEMIQVEHYQAMMARAKQQMQELEQRLQPQTKVQFTTEVESDWVPNTLVNACPNPGEGMLILGSHGHSRAYDLLIGSIAQAVIKKSKNTVMVVPVHTRNTDDAGSGGAGTS